ncbi:hypothetical protein Poli38472_009405 [Pythium oligandrum]|uniref:Uncharacterized protein n=1 Tax=Pythium oligandrum TaxID=41045 RepID=A0A8K1CLP0_PYTOL|nr:hypothetical protein Poli38472_009405 [Pythium oligandrum]|eukprot:TMW65238.1 hypothetical protein Poli38472_009405 [Pythium oligandrum]
MSPASGSSSGSGSGSRGGAVGDDDAWYLVGDRDRNSTGDTCGYYQLESGQSCRKPRRCYDCLNAEVEGEPDGCVLTPTGACKRMDAYVPNRDFRADNVSYTNYYPSINTTYCESTDPACDRCRKIAAEAMQSSVAFEGSLEMANKSDETVRRFCRGIEGCVCVAVCESPQWRYSVQEDCSTGNDTYDISSDDNYKSALPIFMALQVLLIIMVVYRQGAYARRYRRRRAAEGPYNANAISSPRNRLQLTGWRAMHENMINREKAQHGLVSLMSPRTGDEPLEQNVIMTDDEIPELPEHYALETPMNRPRRASTDMAILEDGRPSDLSRRPTHVDDEHAGEENSHASTEPVATTSASAEAKPPAEQEEQQQTRT